MAEKPSPAEVAEVVKAVAEFLQDKGIVSLTIFHNGERWQMASPKYPASVIATALRSVADQAEAQLARGALNWFCLRAAWVDTPHQCAGFGRGSRA